MSDRRAGWALLLVGVAAAAVTLLAATLGGDRSAGTAPAPGSTLEQEVELGVVNLRDYCRYLGYAGNTGDACFSGRGRKAIDPGAACDWQYGGHGLTARRTGGTWACAE